MPCSDKPPRTSASSRLVARLRRVLLQDRGISAVEFALLSPLLVLGGFATVDAGMAVYEEMTISNALRSGAHIATTASTEAQILTIVDSVATENFTVASGSPSSGELSTSVTSYCICPPDTAVVTCTSTCTDNAAPQKFYSISASKDFNGIILPPFTLSGSIDVIAQ